MAVWLRIVLWVVVILVPGGILLLPLLAADAVRARSLSVRRTAPLAARVEQPRA